jgi:hypothetical protein
MVPLQLNYGTENTRRAHAYISSVNHDKGHEHAVKLHLFHILMSILEFSTLKEDCIEQQQLCRYTESTST